MHVYGGSLIPPSAEPVAIAAVDPQFRRDDFLEFAVSVHRNLHGAVASGDTRSITAVTSEALRASLADRKGSKPVERLDHASILEATHGSVDAITVRFGAVIGGAEVVEDWVFERNANEYPHLRGVLPTACASCGAPLSVDDRGNCRYCATHVFGVAGAWQVSNILSPRIVEAPEPSAVQSLGPEHGLEDLLSFARSLYANVHQATASGRVASLHGALTAKMSAYLSSNPDDHCWGVPIERVDTVSLVRVQRGALDVITVRIQAVTEGGPFLEDWTFERPAGRVRKPTACPCCGAAIALDERGNCGYCRTHLLGVAGDWRLARAVQPAAMHTNPVVLRAMQSKLGRVLLLFLLLGTLLGFTALVVALVLW